VDRKLNISKMNEAFTQFSSAHPYPHCIVDDFIDWSYFEKLEEEFLPYDSPRWFVYDNPVEKKKALNDWNAFPPATYDFFHHLISPQFVGHLSSLVGDTLYADPGLHGGGWHIHGQEGNLNPHLDYSIHPKLGLQRRINLIIYAERGLQEDHGGHLGLWEHDPVSNLPGRLAKEIQPRCNRAVFFDTSCNSWHGMGRPLVQPEGLYRKSFAIYYLCDPAKDADKRGRALFALRKEQKDDGSLDDLIALRANVENSSKVYRQ
jgi:hypothetical protein